MAKLTKDQVNVDLFNEVKRLREVNKNLLFDFAQFLDDRGVLKSIWTNEALVEEFYKSNL